MDYIEYTIIPIDENDNIPNRAKRLNQNLMQIDITQNIEEQAKKLGYKNKHNL